MLDYGVIATFNANRPKLTDYEIHHKLYIDILADKSIETFYCLFNDYSAMDLDSVYEQEKKGTNVIFDSVDKNYLLKEEVEVLDINGGTQNIKNVNKMFFLIPLSKKHITEKFNNYYLKNDKLKIEYSIYYYKDRNFDTYLLNIKNKKVFNPIIRVINDEIKISYLEYGSTGISVFGMQDYTGLKIKIPYSKEETFSNIQKHLINNNLTNLLTIDNFESFKDNFNDQIIKTKTTVSILLLLSLSSLCVYLFINVQIYKLFIHSYYKEILVRMLLGFSKNEIFRVLENNNIVSFLISATLSILIIFTGLINFSELITIIILLFTINIIINFLIKKRIKVNKLFEELKGC